MLEQILKTKREEIKQIHLTEPASSFPRRSLYEALKRPRRTIGLIAEVKKASPSKGVIRPHVSPREIARAYEKAGADAISVLTDERYFQGHRSYLTAVKQTVDVPVLRKDFIIDAKQITESVHIGADAILLIGEALEPEALHELYEQAYAAGLECLVEVHSAKTLEAILRRFTPTIIGINNRDLTTFHTSLVVTETLASLIPNGSLLVSESGIFTYDDVQTVKRAGAQAMLVGEALMREEDVALAIRRLFGEV
ncbi:indole-3-glycerol phosphate synthase TrpC [Thermolongibacillus altinsuensis]